MKEIKARARVFVVSERARRTTRATEKYDVNK